MEEIKITTGSGFEGYEIVEYLGIVNGHIAFSSNLFKDLSANLTEWTIKERAAFTSMLESTSENAVEKLIQAAKAKGANAIIGVKINCTGFSANAVGTIASATAVVIEKKEALHKDYIAKLSVSNYYDEQLPRPVELTISGVGNIVNLSSVFYNYSHDSIKAIRCDIEFINCYNEKLLLQGIDFIPGKVDDMRIQTNFVECRLSVKDIPLIKDVKIYIRKFATEQGVFIPETESIDVSLSKKTLENLKEKCGMDAVDRYRSDGINWVCNCGHVNIAAEKECEICGRKEENIQVNVGFDYEEMCNRMKGLPNVAAMKDVLMEYIKLGKLESKYRMELLEIMESGLQYEKTRGDMTGTVLEKVMMVFD